MLRNGAYNIIKLRSQMGLTQRDLGKILGISHVTVHQYERGVRSPSIKRCKVLMDLAKEFKLNLDFEYFRPDYFRKNKKEGSSLKPS